MHTETELEDIHSDKGHKPHILGVLVVLFISIVLLFFHKNNFAMQGVNEDVISKGKVIDIISENEVLEEETGKMIVEQELLVDIKSKNVEIYNDFVPVQKGDSLFLKSINYGGEDNFSIVSVDKSNGILWLSLAFVIILLLTNGIKGAYSIVGLIFTFSIVITFIIPQILKGSSPANVGILGSIISLIGSLYASYGFNKKSITALIGISATLIFVGIVANLVVYNLHFSGFSNDESVYLNLEVGNTVNLIGLVVAGILIATIGVLDDIAITQSSLVLSLKSANNRLSRLDLFKKAMEVGRDHISAVVNTLILAYTGAALPLILLFSLQSFSYDYIVSYDPIAEEIVRTLISSAGLILAVPITTFIATLFVEDS